MSESLDHVGKTHRNLEVVGTALLRIVSALGWE